MNRKNTLVLVFSAVAAVAIALTFLASKPPLTESVDVIMSMGHSDGLMSFLGHMPFKFETEEVELSPGLLDDRGNKMYALKLTHPSLHRPVILVASPNDSHDDAMVVALLESKFRVRVLIYAGSCGLLSDQYNLFSEMFVPKLMLNSSLEYLTMDERVLKFPAWSDPLLISFFKPVYGVQLDHEGIRQKIASLQTDQGWKGEIGKALAGQGQNPNLEVHINLDTVNISGSQFIAGQKARAEYSKIFNAQTVDMRAQQIVRIAKLFHSEAAAVLSCADLAGADHPEGASQVFWKNVTFAKYATAFSAIKALMAY